MSQIARLDIRQFARLLKHTEAPFTGKPFIPQPWQDDYLDKLFNTLRPDGKRQYQRSFLALPRKQGKAQALDTPILTSNGWKTIGEIKVGDRVFHPSGKQVTVIALSEIMENRECFAVGFAGGETIVADADHLWLTSAREDKPGIGKGNHGVSQAGERIRTTREIHQTCYRGYKRPNGQASDRNHSVTVAEPLSMEESELPIAPYVLGVWLGDGNSANARVTVHKDEHDIVNELVACGCPATVWPQKGRNVNTVTLGGRRHNSMGSDRRLNSVQARLRKDGLLHNKHIPRQYLQASVEQREALLQGLMDTDGTCGKKGECEFCNTNRRLAYDFLELATGLGYKVTLKESDAKLYGRVVSKKYRVQFTPLQPRKVFRMKRKQARVKSPPPCTAPRSRTRAIVSCDPCPSVPVRCIQVSAPDGMYLVGRSLIPTHNSALCAVTAAYEGLFGPAGGQIIIAAGDRNQASLLFTACRRYIESNPHVEKRCKLYRNSIVVPSQETTIQFVSSEHRGKHGYNPSLVLLDEAHVQKNRDLIDVLESGMGARDEPLVIYITTAGMERIGPCYDEWQRAIKVRDGIIDDPTYLPLIYAADDSDDPFDEATWRKAQPNYGITTQKSFMEREAMLAKESVAQEIKFRTLYLNQWVSNGANRFFKSGVIEPCLAQPLRSTEGRPCYCGIDLSSNIDTTAFVAVWPQEDGTWDVHCMIFIPEVNARKPEAPYLQWEREKTCILTEGDLIDYDVVRQYVLDFCEKHDVKAIGIDRYNATHITTQLIADGIPVKPFGQGYISMSSPTKFLETLALGNRIRLGGNKPLAAHLMNMQCRMDPAGNIKPTKENSNSTQRIDAAVALVMALGVAGGEYGGEQDYTDEILVL